MFQPIIDAIKESVKPEAVTVRGKEYVSSDGLYLPPREDVVSTLKVRSLTAISDYLEENVDGVKDCPVFIHVHDPTSVTLYKQVIEGNEEGRRHAWLTAVAESSSFRFGTYFSQENFLILFQQAFDSTGDYNDVINYASSIQADNSLALADNGLSQEAIFKKSAVKSERLAVKNPVQLAPFRTFSEIEQPISSFILRFKQDEGQINIALFEVDDPKWEKTAVMDIAIFLFTDKKVGVPVIA